MSLMSWLAFGSIVGVVANLIDPKPSAGGVLGAIALGIGGALIGGFLGSVVLGIGISGFNLSSFFVAVLGSMLLLLVGRSLREV